ncbi:leucine rich repeat domain-containing protein [Hirsutella rhossiliensis]|uniref:Leucine rich repeat domain-containing protein n=1 Tax=Hirsutella rhossiliensis TaxID=111463 RepID=A0A9P8MW99_9HYPO|nr:leucine rich repeat domain-containing protein [Hirsutella rhossiliensis]KAH0961544.1 leucine rich repeat domain-containing protein [Hirsutella rhossiliensis]
MDGSQERPSAIPRLSRLPVPRSASAIPKPASTIPGPSAVRRAPSGENIGRGPGLSWDLQPPKLRHASSRGQLRPGSNKATPSPSSTAQPTSANRQPRAQKPKAPRAVPQSQRRAHTMVDHAAARRASSFVDAQFDAPHRGSQELGSHDVLGNLPAAASAYATPTPVKSRLSLSERTIGTLAQIPSSPAMTKRPSSFFEQARPASGAESDSRPGSSADNDEPAALNLRAPSAHVKPSASASCAASRRASMAPSSKLPGSSLMARPHAKSPTAGMKSYERSPVKSEAKTVAEKSGAPRAPVKGLFRKPSLSVVGSSAEKSSSSGRLSSDPDQEPAASWAEPAHSLSSRKSSAALRQQIAKAKAAKRAVIRQASNDSATLSNPAAPTVPSDHGFDFDGGIEDPFNLRRGENASSKVLKQRVATARTSGRLNIAALGLKEIPTEVMKMYDLESIGAHDGSWAESVDLTRLVAADNELETLDDAAFPDASPDAVDGDEDSQSNVFGGLETLDLHGNVLVGVPLGFRRLAHLTSLNLSSNRLGNDCVDVISHMTALKDLKLSKNRLSGPLNSALSNLELLEMLDVHGNSITALPQGVENLSPVHTVSLSMNRLQELPDMSTWTSLVTLTVDENSISSIPNSFTSLEKLRHADLSSNDIRAVPPEIARMAGLSMLRLTGNPLRDKKFASATTDELKEILAGRLEPPPPYQEPGDMHTMTDLMGCLVEMDSKIKMGRATMVVENIDGDSRSDADDNFATPPTSAPHSPTPTTQVWPVKPGGLLDRSRTASSALSDAMCSEVAARHQVRQVQLHHNLFTCMPSSLGIFSALASLSISHNQLTGDCFLAEELTLPALREINLASNLITNLEPLIRLLHAPALDKMDVSMNRIRSIPRGLKQAFPQLTVLLASNNQLTELEPESIKGLKTVDVSSNDIAQLNPRIGLLGGQGGLQRLEVTGNRFKVPRWNILERGTEATLRWLRGRVPADEMAAWREGNDDESGDEVD